jgi:hypothetical protein
MLLLLVFMAQLVAVAVVADMVAQDHVEVPAVMVSLLVHLLKLPQEQLMPLRLVQVEQVGQDPLAEVDMFLETQALLVELHHLIALVYFL